jgi:hypothetical protein
MSHDPTSFASDAGLEISSSGVRVVIELAIGADLPRAHGVQVDARYANLVQGRMPVSELCALARESAVLSVAPPARPKSRKSRP